MINQENTRLEGSGANRLIQLMKIFGHTVDMTIHIATVTSVEPFSIKLVGDSFDLEEDSLIIAHSLKPYERQVSINGNEPVTMRFTESLVAVNDEVIVLEIQDGQTYVVLDKVGD